MELLREKVIEIGLIHGVDLSEEVLAIEDVNVFDSIIAEIEKANEVELNLKNIIRKHCLYEHSAEERYQGILEYLLILKNGDIVKSKDNIEIRSGLFKKKTIDGKVGFIYENGKICLKQNISETGKDISLKNKKIRKMGSENFAPLHELCAGIVTKEGLLTKGDQFWLYDIDEKNNKEAYVEKIYNDLWGISISVKAYDGSKWISLILNDFNIDEYLFMKII